MKYQIVASPIKGQKIIKNVSTVRELHDTLAECRELGYDVKSVRRHRAEKVVPLAQAFQLA